jgi:hypothetical protein
MIAGFRRSQLQADSVMVIGQPSTAFHDEIGSQSLTDGPHILRDTLEGASGRSRDHFEASACRQSVS